MPTAPILLAGGDGRSIPLSRDTGSTRAIEDVKRDLEDPRAMDRLICGTSATVKPRSPSRAAFKVVSEGKQVAVLCRRRYSRRQHFNTFTERLAAFPIQVDMLSRFRNKSESR